jgi:hypothetical protein
VKSKYKRWWCEFHAEKNRSVQVMSFIANRQRKPVLPLPPAPGCVQCGARLELNDFGKIDPAGTCFNCQTGISDGDDDEFEELED